MQLRYLQSLLEQLYEIDIGLDVEDFLITDQRLAALLDRSRRPRDIPEKLLIEQSGETIDVSLYLHEAILERLHAQNPLHSLHRGNLIEFLTALEGVSHFVYLAWNLGHDRPISQLEMELQAEVDKYCLAAALFARQLGGIPDELHPLLFERVRYSPELDRSERQRYGTANHHAKRYCRTLYERFLRPCRSQRLTRELRHFYRLWHRHKIERIEAFCAA
ncbi:MAG TPA: hypothetical protein VK971_09600 [Thiohalobacter sp.]|nr:hypothetical protein [Thiohalobacter sp.]